MCAETRARHDAKGRIFDPAEVARRYPEVVLASWCGKKVKPDAIRGRPGWDAVAAVRAGRGHERPSEEILRPGPAALTDGLDRLAAHIAEAAGRTARRADTGGRAVKEVVKVGDVAIVELEEDRLDGAAVPSFRKGMEAVRGACPRIVLDLGAVSFLDSSGLASVLACFRAARAEGGDLRLCGLTRPVRALFDLVRMDQVIPVHATREEAIAAMRRRPRDRATPS